MFKYFYAIWGRPQIYGIDILKTNKECLILLDESNCFLGYDDSMDYDTFYNLRYLHNPSKQNDLIGLFCKKFDRKFVLNNSDEHHELSIRNKKLLKI